MKIKDLKRKGKKALKLIRCRCFDIREKIRNKIQETDRKRLLRVMIISLIDLFIAYEINKVSYVYRHFSGNSIIRLIKTLNKLNLAANRLIPSIHPIDIAAGIAGLVIIKMIIKYRRENAKKYRKGREYGSARWGNENDIKPFKDPIFENNLILTQTEWLTMRGIVKNPAFSRNKNVMVVGGSGSGKTRFFAKPNIMQMNSSYVVTDPKGQILIETGKMLEKGCLQKDEKGRVEIGKDGKPIHIPYRIKVFNTVDFKASMHYNPFRYIHSEKDILKLVNTLMENTKGDGGSSGDQFWEKAERLLYTAYIGYIWYEGPPEEQNFNTLIQMIDYSETREEEGYENVIDGMFKELEEYDENHFAVRQYRKYKLAAGKTAKSILVSCGARLSPFDIKELREITSYDEMDLHRLGDERTALFVIVSDTDSSFNFLAAILYSQLFNLLCEKADSSRGGRLPVHVRCILDEFPNIGKIPQFEKLIATIRSRNISASIILQTKSQLKALYKEQADTIEGNCDSVLFLGGKEKTTLKELEENLGKETIDLFNTSDTRGNSPSTGVTYQKTGKQLMSQDELAVMDGGKCILQLRGVRPFLSDKYDITKHKQYKNLSDSNKKNAFDIGKYLKNRQRAKVKPDDEVDDSFDAGIVEGIT